ncbi:DUF3854 domain-containing protein [Arthrobacter sp. H20]|uniref:DUF3854 domain-containing protein n=1 Tax=Arthrobacter sp. H20 TaxID=1267981 RepID=UPI00047C68C5|nr:DUF3854 domain-containing protein [Arthrobacter sp. H20]
MLTATPALATPFTPSAPGDITAVHLELLAKEAINEMMALAAGVRSIENPKDLPEELRWAYDGPGLLFMNHRLDGSTVPQYRPDKPTKTREGAKKPTKYYLPKNSGSSPYIHPSQRHLIGNARKVCIVEGTKGCLGCISAADDANRLNDVLFIGVAGVTGGRGNGTFHADWMDLIMPGAEVTVFFDADLQKNLAVYEAAALLQQNLTDVCDASVVKFARIPVSGDAGASDWLGTLPVRTGEFRFSKLMGLADKATSKLGRRPAAKAKARNSVGGGPRSPGPGSDRQHLSRRPRRRGDQ